MKSIVSRGIKMLTMFVVLNLLTGCTQADVANIVVGYIPGVETLIIGTISTVLTPFISSFVNKIWTTMPRLGIVALDGLVGSVGNMLAAALAGLPTAGAAGALYGLLGNVLKRLWDNFWTQWNAQKNGLPAPTVSDGKVYVPAAMEPVPSKSKSKDVVGVAQNGQAVKVSGGGFAPWSKA